MKVYTFWPKGNRYTHKHTHTKESKEKVKSLAAARQAGMLT